MSEFKINCNNCYADKTKCNYEEGMVICSEWTPEDLDISKDKQYWFKMELDRLTDKLEKKIKMI